MSIFEYGVERYPERLEWEISLRAQYKKQIDLLEKEKLLKVADYPVPTYQEITGRIREKEEFLNRKIEQGFGRLLIVPFFLPLKDLFYAYDKALWQNFDDQRIKQGKLLYPTINPTDLGQPITKIHEHEGLLKISSSYDGNPDMDGRLVYEPLEFSNNHRGKTKAEIVDKKGGWGIFLAENNPSIPQMGMGKKVGGRTQIDTKGKAIPDCVVETEYYLEHPMSPTAQEYLNSILAESEKVDSPYYGEKPMNPEAYTMYALTVLEETGQIIDCIDYTGSLGGVNNSATYGLGAYFPSGNRVPVAYWDEFNKYFSFNSHLASGPYVRRDDFGVRMMVEI